MGQTCRGSGAVPNQRWFGIGATGRCAHRNIPRQNGEASKLVGRVVDVELAGGGERTAAPAPAPRAAPAPRPAPAQSGGHGFESMDDDIPFMDPLKRSGAHLVM